MKFWKKEYDDILMDGNPQETLGFSKDKNYYEVSNNIFQKFMIKNYNLNSTTQIGDIKKQLMSRKVLIINAKELLENQSLTKQELKNWLDEIRVFLKKCGGSMGRINDCVLILTPSPSIKLHSN
jgi:SepF-like predicted cell division protein (DUF552 family)